MIWYATGPVLTRMETNDSEPFQTPSPTGTTGRRPPTGMKVLPITGKSQFGTDSSTDWSNVPDELDLVDPESLVGYGRPPE